MKNNLKLKISCISAALTLILILLLRLVDVAPIGAEGTYVGLAHLNMAVFELFGVHMIFYEITDWLGILAVLTAAAFALLGLVQLIRRKSFVKVDKEILMLGGLYVAVIALYVFFEFVVVNCRPILMEGSTHAEASFPSSHTMLACVIFGSAFMILDKYVKNQTAAKVLKIACVVLICVTVIGRLIAGVHWFTDILGGLLITAALLSLFSALLDE